MTITQHSIAFHVTRKELLNSNVPVHMMVKSKIVKNLRALAASEGLQYHDEDNRPQAELRYLDIQEERRLSLEKSRLVKRSNAKIKKAKTEEEKNELRIRLEESLEDLGTFEHDINNHHVSFLYDTVRVTATICPPTRRHIDPPNLWPTVKALLDGLTDASWWQDDDFTHVVETSFRYGGLSGIKDKYSIYFQFEEVDNSDGNYITEAIHRPVEVS